MSEKETKPKAAADSATITVRSTRFGDLEVPRDSVIEIPSGLIGFPRLTKFVMIEHKAPFSWLHSTEDPHLAFVVVDGFAFGTQYSLEPPVGDKDSDLREGDEFAILVIVTVRPDPKTTTVNLKAPVFVNIRNRRGVQVIYDDPRYSTRHPLWGADSPEAQGGAAPASGEKSGTKKEK